MPPGAKIAMTIAGAIGANSANASAAAAMLEFLAAPTSAAVRRRHGIADSTGGAALRPNGITLA